METKYELYEIIENYEGKYITPIALYNKGIGLCCFCNNTVSADSLYCGNCCTKTTIILTENPEPEPENEKNTD